MAELHNMQCCGLKEISGISSIGMATAPNRTAVVTPKSFLLNLIRNTPRGMSGLGSAMIFTGAGLSKTEPVAYAVAFAAFIEENNLGTVYLIPRLHRNKNTGRYIATYVWHQAPRNLGAWYKRNA